MEINSLKVNQEISDIKEQLNGLLDLFYPVGSYYETSDISFNPNSIWGGTWVDDTKGYVTVGALRDGGDTPLEGGLEIDGGSTMGSVEHYHLTTWGHYIGSAGDRYKVTDSTWGAIDSIEVDVEIGNWRIKNPDQTLKPATATQDTTDYGSSVQPSIGVYRWHRIA